ncbi:MAG TPA: hypothetical protein VFE78_06880 [Gemmataceae bacterium]|nr:hypothetical protein [Gemmataceae bacterium]
MYHALAAAPALAVSAIFWLYHAYRRARRARRVRLGRAQRRVRQRLDGKARPGRQVLVGLPPSSPGPQTP